MLIKNVKLKKLSILKSAGQTHGNFRFSGFRIAYSLGSLNFKTAEVLEQNKANSKERKSQFGRIFGGGSLCARSLVERALNFGV